LAVAGYYDERSEPARLLRLDADGIQRDLLDRLIPALTARHPRPEGGLYDSHDVTHWLTSLSLHLRERQTRGGSGTDLYLHELWRAAGDRVPRYQGAAAVATALAAPLLALGAVYDHVTGRLLAPNWQGRFMVVLCAILVIVGLIAVAQVPSYQRRLDLKTLWTRRAARVMSAWLVVGLAGGLVVGLTSRVTAGFTAVLTTGLLTGLAFGLAEAARREQTSIKQPHQLIRQNLIYACAVTLAFALAAGLASLLAYQLTGGALGWLASGPTGDPTTALMGGLTIGLAVGLLFSLFDSPWPRYVAAVRILTRRGQLPRRPARFLDWACEVGLLKISGIALQFRHQNLQDRLLTPNAAEPAPLPLQTN
jgi:MFS family permease